MELSKSQIAKARWKSRNRDKVKVSQAAYDAKNPEKLRARQKAYRERNRERVAAMVRDWKDRNPDRARAYRVGRLSHYAALSASRRARIMQAMPSWCEAEAIEVLYATAKALTAETGVQHSVDHIVPLAGKTVCGLHCLANLQVVETRYNIRKGNRFWPDMP